MAGLQQENVNIYWDSMMITIVLIQEKKDS
jgi:hypothetical protein